MEIRHASRADCRAMAGIDVCSCESAHRAIFDAELPSALTIDEHEARWHVDLADPHSEMLIEGACSAVFGFASFGFSRDTDAPGGQGDLRALYKPGKPDTFHIGGRQVTEVRMMHRGFTLLELLVVIVIIGLLAGLVVPRYFNTLEKSKPKIAQAQLAALDHALDQYRFDVGSLPPAIAGLNALIAPPPGVRNWQGPYLKKAVPLDPWGHAYVYRLAADGREAEVLSYGADGQPGGSGEAADLSSNSN